MTTTTAQHQTAAAARRQAPEIAVRDLLQADPVGYLLLVRCRLHFAAMAGVCLILLILLLVVLPIRFAQPSPSATLLDPGDFFATSDGFMTIVSWLIFVPVVWGFYAWQPAAIARLHTRLDESLGHSAADVSASRFRAWYNNPLSTAVAAFLAGWIVYRFTRPRHSFVTAGPWIYESTAALETSFVALASLTYYMMALLVIRQFLAAISINRTFAHASVPIRFLHPDQCGGLGFLGDHALGITPLIAAAGLNISLGYVRLITGASLGSDTALYSLLALTAVYVAGSVTAFWALLWSAHVEMVNARDAWLDDVAAGFNLHQVVVQQEMRSGNPDAESVAKLDAARRAWDIGRSLPTWPLNTGTVRNFSAALLSPLGPIAIASVQRLLGG